MIDDDDNFSTASGLDNFCEYWVYFPPSAHNSIESCLDRLRKLSGAYLWHRDPMEAEPQESLLYGKTYFGDCIDDEWQIIRILRQLSMEEPDLVIRCVDNDGQFLLIEAANALPRWMMDPERMWNRVFIRSGRLQIIPQSVEVKRLDDAVQWMLSTDTGARHSAVAAPVAVERALLHRLIGGEDKHQMTAQCILPRHIARVLVECPQWISAAVEAFYARDLLSLRACQKMEQFPPETSVLTSVRITRQMYAQLSSQRFHPPKPFLKVPALASLFAEQQQSHLRRQPPSREFKWAELGMKLACGFEILMRDKFYSASLPPSVGELANSSQPDIQQFTNHLTALGYFNIADSVEVENRNLQSSWYFHRFVGGRRDLQLEWTAAVRSQPQRYIPLIIAHSLLKYPSDTGDFDAELERRGYWQPVDIDETWMEISEAELEQMLRERSPNSQQQQQMKSDKNNNNNNNKGNNTYQNGDDIESVVDRLQQFLVMQQSGVDGVEVDSNDNYEDDYEDEDDYDYEDDYEDEDNYEDWSTGSSNSEDGGEWDNAEHKAKQFQSLLYQMEQELLADTKVMDGFERCGGSADNGGEGTMINVELNLAKNLLSSFDAEQGLPGPTGTLLRSLGFTLPRNEVEKDEDESDASDTLPR